VWRALGSFPLVAAVFAAAGCAHDSAEPPTFESSLYEYSLRLPKEWSTVSASRALKPGEQPLTASGVTDIVGRNARTRVSQMEMPGVIVAAQPLARDFGDSDTWTETVVGIVGAQKGCERPADRIAVAVDGERAEMLVYPDCPPASGLHHLWIAVAHDGRGYHIVWFNNAEAARTDQSSFRALLEDLEFAD
jgi:hypothetical protein